MGYQYLIHNVLHQELPYWLDTELHIFPGRPFSTVVSSVPRLTSHVWSLYFSSLSLFINHDLFDGQGLFVSAWLNTEMQSDALTWKQKPFYFCAAAFHHITSPHSCPYIQQSAVSRRGRPAFREARLRTRPLSMLSRTCWKLSFEYVGLVAEGVFPLSFSPFSSIVCIVTLWSLSTWASERESAVARESSSRRESPPLERHRFIIDYRTAGTRPAICAAFFSPISFWSSILHPNLLSLWMLYYLTAANIWSKPGSLENRHGIRAGWLENFPYASFESHIWQNNQTELF